MLAINLSKYDNTHQHKVSLADKKLICEVMVR